MPDPTQLEQLQTNLAAAQAAFTAAQTVVTEKKAALAAIEPTYTQATHEVQVAFAAQGQALADLGAARAALAEAVAAQHLQVQAEAAAQ